MMSYRNIKQFQRILVMQQLYIYLLVLRYVQIAKIISENQSGNLIEEADEQGQVNSDYIYLGNVPIARVDEWWKDMKTPAAPTGVTVTPGDTQLTVSWDANEEPIDGYKVYWGTESGNYTNSIDVGNTTSYTITGLNNGTTYYVAVKSYADIKETYFYHTDHLGTPILMTDKNGNKGWEGEFLPFGEAYSITGTVTNNLRFPGQYYDEETGLNYNYFRDYKPEIGRYIEFDPILHLISRTKQLGACRENLNSSIPRTFTLVMETPKFLNPRVYAANDPVNSIDPSGLLPQTPGEWLNLINNMKKIGKLCYECNDIEKHMLKGSGQGIADECLNCCDALSKIYGGVLKHTVRDTCVSTLCMKK